MNCFFEFLIHASQYDGLKQNVFFLMIAQSDVGTALSNKIKFICQSESWEWCIVQECVLFHEYETIYFSIYCAGTILMLNHSSWNRWSEFKHVQTHRRFSRLRGGYIVNDIRRRQQKKTNYRIVIVIRSLSKVLA